VADTLNRGGRFFASSLTPRKFAVAILLLVFILSTPTAMSLSSGPEQFNPGGSTKFTVDPYSGGVVRASSDFTYNPLASALDTTHHRLYLMELAGLIIVIDTQTNKPLPEIDLGPGESTNMIYDSQEGLLYVASTTYGPYTSFGHILAINTTTDEVVANMSAVTEPAAMALDTTNGRLFVGSEGGYGIDVFDTSNDVLLKVIQANQSSFQNAMFDPANGDIYLPDGNLDQVLVVNGSSLNVVGAVPTKYYPYQALFDPVNSNIYFVTFNYGFPMNPHSRVLGFNASTGQVIANITLNPYYVSMFVDSQSGYLYFVGVYLPYYNISAIDPSSNKIARTMNTTELVTLASDDSQLQRAYLTTQDEYVVELDTGSFSFVQKVPLFATPNAMSFDAHDQGMYVASSLPGTNTTWISLLSGPRLVGSIGLGGSAGVGEPSLAVSSKTGLAYVSLGNDTIFVVNGTASKLIGTILTKSTPTSMLYDPDEDTLLLLESVGGQASLEAINLTTNLSRSASMNILPATMGYDDVHDRLIVGDGRGNIALVDPTTLQTVATYPLSVNGVSLFPEGIAYDSADNLVYVGASESSNPSSAVLLALNGSTGQELYYSNAQSGQGLVYDQSNGYIYALAGGATPILALVDLPLGTNSVPFSGQFASCMALDPANGYLYLGARVPGVITIDQTGPSLPGFASAQTVISTTTVIERSSQLFTSTVTSLSTSTVTTTVPAPTTVLDLGLAGGIVVLLGLLGMSLLTLRKRRKHLEEAGGT
jgi:hypothetical protein